MGADAPIRTYEAGEHLALLRSLARELERAMRAIAQNDLVELEDSITSQQDLSVRLTELARDRRGPASATTIPNTSDGDLKREVMAAASELQKLNLRYSMLIEHSSRSAAQMAALFSSFRGQFQEASGAREKYQTLSCQV
jgi:flagellar biosynthesis/type III secretory pathway chaperone